MYGLLLTLMVLDGILLVVVILLQSGKGGGLAAMGGGGGTATDGILGGRQASSVLIRSTWTMGGLFMVLGFVLSIMSSRASQPTSILRLDAPVSAPTPVLPGSDATIPGVTDEPAGGGEATPPPADPGTDPGI